MVGLGQKSATAGTDGGSGHGWGQRLQRDCREEVEGCREIAERNGVRWGAERGWNGDEWGA